jgi:aspartate 1-decarboxylase
MIRSFVRSLIHNATVTESDSTWPASLRIDAVLLRAAEILPLEAVEVINLATGDRFRTWAEEAPEGSGEVRVHGGLKHPVRSGDTISIVVYGLLHDGQTIGHRARVVTVDAKNAVVAITET